MAITIIAPPPTAIISQLADIELTIRATNPPLKRAIVSMVFPGMGRTEEVHDGDNFLSPYRSSLREAFSDATGAGFRFVVRRDGGWPDGPTMKAVAYDEAGGDVVV